MDLSKTELEQLAKEMLEASGVLKVSRKFTPGQNATDFDSVTSGGGFKSFGDFLHTIKVEPGDTRLKALSEAEDSSGGFLVPEEMRKDLLTLVLESSVIRPHATSFKMGSETLSIPRIVDTSHSSNLFGGVIAYWTKESTAVTATEPEFGLIKLTAKKLMGYTYAPNELLEDSAINLELLIKKCFSESISWFEEEAFIRGDGAGEPLGILNSGAVIEVSKETGQAADTILAENVWKMYSRMFPASVKKAVWLANPNIKPELYAMAVPIGTGGVSVYLPAGGISQTPYDTLCGRPVLFTEHCSTLGDAGDLLFCDLSYYIIGDRRQLTVAASPHIRFTTDQTAWRFTQRVDGQPWLNTYFTPKRGSTLSPFISLEAR